MYMNDLVNFNEKRIVDTSDFTQKINELELCISNLNTEKHALENIIDATNAGTWSWIIHSGDFSVNEQWAQITGYAIKELLPISVDTWNAMVHPDDLLKLEKVINLLFCKDITQYEIEVRIKHKLGNWILVRNRGKVISWDIKGKPIEVIGCLLDVDNFKKTSNILSNTLAIQKQSELLLLGNLKSHKNVIILFVDKNYCYLYFNDLHKQLMKTMYNQDIVIGKSILDYITVDSDRAKSKRNYDMSLIGESFSANEEYGSVKKMIFKASFSPVIDNENNIAGVAVFARNITEIVKQKKELKYEKELAQRYLNLAGTIIVVLDENGTVTLINQKGCSIIGSNRKDIVGKNWFDNYIEQDEVEDVKKVFKNVFNEATKHIKNFENNIITSEGDIKTIYWENNFLYDSDEKRIGVICSGEDVTEIREKDEKLMHISYHDQLTGLYNRRFFEAQSQKLDTSSNLPLSVIMGDVNGLKLINDAFGHKSGDELLKLIGETIKESIRENDIATRWGGDEFVILLPHTGNKEAVMVITRIHQKIKESQFKKGLVSISFGIGTKIDKQEDFNDVFSQAEEQMYDNKLKKVKSIRGEGINYIMNTLFDKSSAEKLHSTSVSRISGNLARAIGLSQSKINDIKTIGLLHDIGKIVIDLRTLEKPGELSSEEKEVIQQHSLSGSRLLNTSHEYARLAAGVLHHHERIDGTGYPNGIKGDQIPIESKIIAIADAFDAMTGTRTYKETISYDEAINEIRQNAGTQFDKKLVKAFVKNFKAIIKDD